MKKIITSVALLGALASTLSADFLRIEMGGGAWMATPETSMTYEDALSDGSDISNEAQDEIQGYVWALVKHPVPVVPNLRVEYSSVMSEGVANGNFKFFPDVTFNDTASNIELTQYDVIPYYNILDNTFWVSLDLGLDIKLIDTAYTATTTSESYLEEESVLLPLLYVRTRFQVPTTGLGVEADVKYISYDDSTVSDIRVKVDYTFEFTPLIQPGIELGYRMEKIEIISDEKLKADFDFSGVYAGLMLRF